MRMLRFEVPVDDRVHGHRLSGPVLHVASRQRALVEFWALGDVEPETMRFFRVYATGQPIPGCGLTYVGTCFDGSGAALVWHLFTGIRQELERGSAPRYGGPLPVALHES